MGLTGLGGIAVTVWCQMVGGTKDAQRAIFQPVMFATFAMSAVSFAVAGTYTVETIKLYFLALPVLIAGIWCGLRLYGKLDDAGSAKWSCSCSLRPVYRWCCRPSYPYS